MKLILITPEETHLQETKAVTLLFENGLELLHVRKPGFTKQELKQYLEDIPSCWYDRIVVHEHFHLAYSVGIRRMHLNKRFPENPRNPEVKVSRSCHSLEEINNSKEFEYVFLSPVFDSVSKIDYHHAFTEESLDRAGQEGIIDDKVIALGGIKKDNLYQVAGWGFGGVALIGSIWKDFAQTGNISSLQERYIDLKIICNSL